VAPTPASRSVVPYVTPPALPPPGFAPSAPPAVTNGNLPTVAAPLLNNIVIKSVGVVVNSIKTAAIAVENAVVSSVKKALTFIGNLFNVTPQKVLLSLPQAAKPSAPSPSVIQNIGDQAKSVFDYIRNLISPR
jgi:hypothetical protein